MNPEEIAQLALRVQAGEQEALEALVQACHPLVYRLSLSILDDPQEAQDAAQEVFIQVVRGIDNYRREASFRTWLYAITLNVCRGRLRKRQRSQRLIEALGAIIRLTGSTSLSPEEQVLQRERKGALVRIIRELPEEQRTALILRYYHELPIAEIAGLMGVVERTIYVWLRKAFERIQAELEEQVDPNS
jgi:RNA polymerase sigma-70 factor (ECF subfamily)